jgi:DNA-binding NtrC family response regulator
MPLLASHTLPRLIGRSAAVRALDRAIDDAARSDACVLITGETGSGKEVAARLVHDRSTRTAGGLVTLNCAGLPDAWLESELFGQPRGGVPGGRRERPGLLDSVPNGSVLVDEVSELSPRMQAVLVRFFETADAPALIARPPAPRPRLMATTNRDLPARIVTGAFRDDLYFRLNGAHVRVPSLRERAEDIPLLIAHYLRQFAREYSRPEPAMTHDALAALVGYRWPGNVRELRHLIDRLVNGVEGDRITIADLPPEYREPADDPARAGTTTLVSQMIERGASFWSTVYPAFMAHDLTRRDLREIIQAGLESTRGSYRALLERFNMSADDYRRFVGFLRQHDCHLPLPAPGLGPVGQDRISSDVH